MEHDIEKSLIGYRRVVGGGFGLVLIAIAFTSILLLDSHRETIAEFEETVLEHNLKVELAAEAEMAVHVRGELQQLMVLEEDPFERDEIFLTFTKNGHRVNVAREKLKQLANTDEEKNLIEQQEKFIQLMVDKHRVINDLLMDEQKDKAAEIIVEAYKDGRLQTLFSTMQTMRALQKQMSEKHLQSSRDNLERITQVTVGVLLLVAAISLIVVFQFWRYASKKSAILAQLVGKLSESNKRHEHLALHDNLTSLPNRTHFFQHADAAQRRSRERDTKLYFLYLDIDGFKPVNDDLGHESGNELLQQIAGRLQEAASGDDFIARLGGDEFIVVTEGRKDDVELLAKRLVEILCNPYVLTKGEVVVGASIGIADSGSASDVDEQVHLADIAMYQSKRDGGCCYYFNVNASADEAGSEKGSHFRCSERDI